MINRIYSIGILFYRIAIQLASLFSNKAKKWVVGRRDWKNSLRKNTPKDGFDLWVHCSSLGEFEQGRPVLEAFKAQFPSAKILLSFFSPSGYIVRKDYPLADYICYLPLDTTSNAKAWLDISKPRQIIFVKYDFWFNFLNEIKSKDIRATLISANFSAKHFFNSAIGKFFKPSLEAFKVIFFQQKPGFEISHKIEQHIVGDTRVDRVIQIQSEAAENRALMEWKGNYPVMIWGSVWPTDYPILKSAIQNSLKEWKHLVAPHEPSEKHLNALQKLIGSNTQFFSASFNKENTILLIDSVGKLAGLYKFGDAAYIGGGFGSGIHNTLEPLAAGCPVLFGPNFKKFPEAINGISKGCSFSVNNSIEFEKIATQLKDQRELLKLKERSKSFIAENQGATQTILEYLTLGHEK